VRAGSWLGPEGKAAGKRGLRREKLCGQGAGQK